MKCLSILGCTGSIGKNVLEIVRRFPERFTVKALAAATNVDLLKKQICEFNPDVAVVYDEKRADELSSLFDGKPPVEILYGDSGYQAAAALETVDTVVSAIVGGAGLLPTLSAIEAGKTIALANKETLVMAGDYVMKKAADNNVDILPVDSEHSAIFQCISGQRREDLSKIHLTASGGPFRGKSDIDFSRISPEDALNHPTWQMGRKISIDSATLMNKGLEVIEAKYLFDLSHDMIDVVVHPQSIVHSMVSYIDGSVIAQIGVPDMKGAIAYALSYPERLPLKQPLPDFPGSPLTFEAPDMKRFACLDLAFTACKVGHTLPCVMNAANEVAVHAFLERRITFDRIPALIEFAMERHSVVENPGLNDILEADRSARESVEACMHN